MHPGERHGLKASIWKVALTNTGVSKHKADISYVKQQFKLYLIQVDTHTHNNLIHKGMLVAIEI